MKKIAGFLILTVLVFSLSACLEQEFPQGKQAKPDNAEKKAEEQK